MKNLDWKDLLSRHHLFCNLKEKEMERLLEPEVSEERDYLQGSVILREGEVADSIFLIGSGSVQVVLQGEQPPPISLSILKKGEFFGEMALIQQRPRSATVIAEENSTLLEIKGKEFLRIIEEHSDIASKVLLTLSERLRRTSEHVLVKLKDVDEKIKLFNTKLDSELKTVEVSLKAAQTVFDQTKMRTDEVINSAERSRTRLTVVASTIATVVFMAIGLFGWFGFSELLDIRKEREKIFELAGQAEIDLKRISQDLKQFNALRTNFYQQIMIPCFHEELEKDTIKALRYYKAILGTKDPFITDYLFDSLVTNIFYLGEIERKNSKDILDLGLKNFYAKTPRQTILSYYLILSALILDNEHEGEEFKKVFTDYKRYVRECEGTSIKKSLERFLTLDDDKIKDLSENGLGKKNWLEDVKELIP